MSVTIFDDLQAEQDGLDSILVSLPEGAWSSASAAPGWSVADVVLHLAQTEEAVVHTTSDDARGQRDDWRRLGQTVDEAMEVLVRAERAPGAVVLQRWRTARRVALDALRAADPQRPLRWVATSLKPRTLATTRLAEHWAHALDITGPLGIAYPDTSRLRHIAWLAHNTLPYAFALAGHERQDLHCELTAPDGDLWRFGPPSAASSITGQAGAFCRVGARRLSPEESGLVTHGPYGRLALRLLRNYAG
jgi:uncharacterized protein (TIGR03084 family)